VLGAYLLQIPILGVCPFVQELLPINYLNSKNKIQLDFMAAILTTRPPFLSCAKLKRKGNSHECIVQAGERNYIDDAGAAAATATAVHDLTLSQNSKITTLC
jgi:hypothetical protein